MNLRQIKYWKIDWVGNNAVDRAGAQAHVIDNLQSNQYPIKSQTQKKGQMWAAVTCDELLSLISKDRGIYEILIPDVPRKVYFDIDHTTLSLDAIKEIILGYFPKARLNISGRLVPDLSLHIILENYYADNLDAMRMVKLIATKHRDVGFDPVVYTKNRNMKCIHQSKIKQPVQEYIDGSKSDLDHLILHGIDYENATNIAKMEFKDVETPDVAKGREGMSIDTQIDILSIPQKNLPVPVNFDIMTALPLDILAVFPCPAKGAEGWLHHNIIERVMVWAKQCGLTYNQFWQWNRQKNDTVERYRRWKRFWEACNYNISDLEIKAYLERTYPKIMETQVTRRFREQFEIPEVRKIDEDFMRAEDISHWSVSKFTVLLAAMGRNKTGAVADYLAKYCQGMSVLWVAPRITLAQNTVERLRQLGIHIANYKYDFTAGEKRDGTMAKCDTLLNSIQSLHYLDRNYDVIIADEWDTIASTFSRGCETHRNKKAGTNHISDNWSIWMSQLQKAKKVIFMDAFTTKMTLNFLEHFRQESFRKDTKVVRLGSMPLTSTKARKRPQKIYEFVNLDRKQNPREFLETESFDDWRAQILAAVRAGKKVYVFTPFQEGDKGVEALSDLLCEAMGWTDQKELWRYHGKRDFEKRDLVNVETRWADPLVRCVVSNSAISVGVNFNQPDIFDQVFAFYTPQISVRDFIQAIYRVRKPISNVMVLYRSKMCQLNNYEDSSDHPDCEVFRQLRQDLMIEQLANGNYKKWETFNFFCEQANITILPQKVEKVSDEVKEYLRTLEEELNCRFSWDKISTIPADVPEEFIDALRKKLYMNSGTMDDRMTYAKYCFMSRFKEQTSDDTMALIWDTHRELPDQLMALRREPEHMINKLLEENKIVLNKDFTVFPGDMKISIPIEEIQSKFHFHNPPRDYRTNLCMRMLEAYFRKKVYYLKQKTADEDGEKALRVTDKDTRKRKWMYETSEVFGAMVAGASPHLNGYEAWVLEPDEE